MEALDNAWYGSWRPLTNLTQTFWACHLCTFNVAAIFFRGHHYICRTYTVRHDKHAGCVFTDKQGQHETRFSLCVWQSARLAASAIHMVLLCVIFSLQAIICIHCNFSKLSRLMHGQVEKQGMGNGNKNRNLRRKLHRQRRLGNLDYLLQE